MKLIHEILIHLMLKFMKCLALIAIMSGCQWNIMEKCHLQTK